MQQVAVWYMFGRLLPQTHLLLYRCRVHAVNVTVGYTVGYTVGFLG